MNKKIAMSAMSILGSLAILGGTTFALFDDSVTQTANTFAAGNADLQIALDTGSGPGTYGETILGPDVDGMFPGEVRTFEFWLKNNSASEIGLDLTADVENIADPVDANAEIDNALLINWVCDTSGDGGLEEAQTPAFSPRAWQDGGLADVGSLAPGDDMICRMFAELPESAGSEVANETVTFDVRYGATQVVPE